jgi:DNA adenine methylase
MRISLVIIGSELLTGKRTDGHMAHAISLVGERGLELGEVTYLADDPKRLAATLARSMASDDVVFSFGGIGATPDDLTRQAAADAQGVPLERHPEAAAIIEDRFGDDAYPQRIHMAHLPRGAALIPNPVNNIAGFSVGDVHFVPGFPQMAWPMMEWVLDTHYMHLRPAVAPTEQLLRLPGISEGQIIDVMSEFVGRHPNLALSCLPTMDGDYRETELGVRGLPSEVSDGMGWLRAALREAGFEPVDGARSAAIRPLAVHAQKGNDTVRKADPEALNPLLKWAGGKRWLRHKLYELYEPFADRRLVEPFCGALGVALGLRPARALLNDVNRHAINFHCQVRKGLKVTLPMRNDRDLYGQHRQTFNTMIESGRVGTKKAASLFYYLNRTGYNGLCRFNKSGKYNVPFGQYNTINYRRDFTAYQAVLEDWRFECGDFQALTLESDDFIYADPPYDVDFRQYSPGGFAWADQERLARWLATHSGPIVVSNQATDRILTLYQELGFTITTLLGPRRISRTGDRTPAMEMLATRGL